MHLWYTIHCYHCVIVSLLYILWLCALLASMFFYIFSCRMVWLLRPFTLWSLKSSESKLCVYNYRSSLYRQMFPSNINDYNKHHVKKRPLILRSKKMSYLSATKLLYQYMENYMFIWLLFYFFSIHPFIILFCGST